MTMTSTGWSLAVSEVTVLTMHFASLYAGTSTVTGFGDRRAPAEVPRAHLAGVDEGEHQHQPEAGEDEDADDGEPGDQDPGDVLGDADRGDPGDALPAGGAGDGGVGAGRVQGLGED